MKKWEHKIVRLNTVKEVVVQRALDVHGNDGWELASYFGSIQTQLAIFIFKRPKVEPSP